MTASALQSLATLHYSPFVLAPVLEAFYENMDVQPQSYLLAYIVLPLVLHPGSRNALVRTNTRSSLRTMLNRSDRSWLYGLPKRVTEYRPLTNRCMQVALESGGLVIGSDLAVVLRKDRIPRVPYFDQLSRAAGRLGEILRPLDVPAVYRSLGIKSL